MIDLLLRWKARRIYENERVDTTASIRKRKIADEILASKYLGDCERENSRHYRRLKKIRDKYIDDARRNCGTRTFVFCKKCGNDLRASNSFVSEYGHGSDNVVTYKCRNCGKVSRYNFDIAIAPVLLDDSMIRDDTEGGNIDEYTEKCSS